MFFEAIVIGGLAWWVLFSILSLAFIVFLAKDDFSATLVVFLIACGLAALFTDAVKSISAELSENPSRIWIYVGAYIGAGVGYSLARWKIFVSKRRAEYDEFKKDWLQRMGIKGTEIPEANKDQFKSSLRSNLGYRIIPEYSEHLDSIIGWGAFWPWSFFWFLIRQLFGNLLVNFWRFILNCISGVFTWIANSTFRDVSKDWE